MNALAHDFSLSRPLETARLRAISLGAGVQSSVLALMAERGEIGPKPDCAIFGDTAWEPRWVYEWLDWLETQLSFPVYRVGRGSLRAKVMGGGSSIIPAFVNGTPVNRGCTRDFKIAPIEKKLRELLGLTGTRAPKHPIVEQWIGISTDEIQRMKVARNSWSYHRFPLIERRMSRSDCIRWMEDRQYPRPPKSACIGCPFHSNEEWRAIKADAAMWADACEADAALRDPSVRRIATRGHMYLHRSGVPLAEVDLSTEAERVGQANLFLNECDGMCGV